jgi:hypothetical protein
MHPSFLSNFESTVVKYENVYGPLRVESGTITNREGESMTVFRALS